MPDLVLASHAGVEAGRIILRAPLSALLLCRRIPNGSWDSQRKAWSYPATQEQARLVQGVIRRLSTTQQFDQLMEPAATRKHEVAPVRQRGAGQPARNRRSNCRMVFLRIRGGISWPPSFSASSTSRWACSVCCWPWAWAPARRWWRSWSCCSRKAQRTLILCPLRVVPVWVTQLERHVGIPLVVVALDDSVSGVRRKQELAAEKMRLAEARGVPFVCIINYDSFWREPFNEWAEKVRWDLFIMDEAHRIKAPGGKASLACKRMRARALVRLGMTALRCRTGRWIPTA